MIQRASQESNSSDTRGAAFGKSTPFSAINPLFCFVYNIEWEESNMTRMLLMWCLMTSHKQHASQKDIKGGKNVTFEWLRQTCLHGSQWTEPTGAEMQLRHWWSESRQRCSRRRRTREYVCVCDCSCRLTMWGDSGSISMMVLLTVLSSFSIRIWTCLCVGPWGAQMGSCLIWFYFLEDKTFFNQWMFGSWHLTAFSQEGIKPATFRSQSGVQTGGTTGETWGTELLSAADWTSRWEEALDFKTWAITTVKKKKIVSVFNFWPAGAT